MTALVNLSLELANKVCCDGGGGGRPSNSNGGIQVIS